MNYVEWFEDLAFDLQLDILDEYDVEDFAELTVMQQHEIYLRLQEKEA